jgi:hypothetical protein
MKNPSADQIAWLMFISDIDPGYGTVAVFMLAVELSL